MQQQLPIRNYVYFFIATMFVIWWFGPRAVNAEKAWIHDRRPAAEQAEALTRIIGHAGAGAGVTDALDFALQYGRVPTRPEAPKPKWDYEFEHPREQNSIIARMVLAGSGGLLVPAEVTQAYALNSRAVARHAQIGQPVQEIVLGGKGFPITAWLTPRGAGVSELVLNEFNAADSYGLPDKDAKGQPKRVTLIPRDPKSAPAFAVFHYPTADEKEPQPLDTLGETVWTLDKHNEDGQRSEATFSTELPNDGVRITKTFSLAKGEYHLGLTVKVERMPGSQAAGKFRYQLAGSSGLPIEGEWYATMFRTAHVGMVDQRDTLYRISADAATVNRTGGSDRFRKDDKRIAYAAAVVQYFASAIAVDVKAMSPAKANFVQFVRATREKKEEAERAQFADLTVRVIPDAIEVTEGAEHRYVLYHGPVKVRQLLRLSGDKAVDPALVDHYADTLKLRSLTDYGSFGWWSDIIILFTNLVHRLLGMLHSFLPGGIAIICVTVLVRACMFPISRRQAKNMQVMQEKMQKLAPEMKIIEAKFKDDFLGKQQAVRELQRKHNVNPVAGLSGCLMLFAQMPIFMGLYFALQENIFFRLEPFLWIRNLAAPDMLAWWGDNVPILSSYLGPYFNILPLVGAVLIFIQQQKSMPAEMTDEQRQQYGMMKMMTVLMAFMFYKVPAGLSLYFIASSLWGLTERYVVKKQLDAVAAERAAGNTVDTKPKAKLPTKPPGRLALWWQQLLRDASKK